LSLQLIFKFAAVLATLAVFQGCNAIMHNMKNICPVWYNKIFE